MRKWIKNYKNQMARYYTFSNRYAIGIGVLLLIYGTFSLFNELLIGSLISNTTYAVILMMLGTIGLYTGTKKVAHNYCLFLGTLLLILGTFWFIPGLDRLLVYLLNLNQKSASMNIALGVASLIAANIKKPEMASSKSQLRY